MSKALGKGLSALIPDKELAVKDKERIARIDTKLIKGNPVQPRTTYDQVKLNELIASIREKGVLQPILVRPRQEVYEVIAGERRLRAAQALALEQVPVLIKDVSDREALVIALIENIQREELNPIEEANAYKKLIEDFQYSQEDVAQSVSKDRSTISNLMRLLKLPDEIKMSLIKGELSVGHARSLLSVESLDEQTRIFNLVLKKGLSVRETENMARVTSRPGAGNKTPGKEKNFQLVMLEEQLQKFLGTKVSIIPSKKRGKIVVEYYSSEDLERIIKVMVKK